jgi:hypothetical protein
MSPQHRWRPIGEILIERGSISERDLEWALGEQRRTGMRLGEILASAGLTSYLALAQAMAVQAEALGPAEPAAPAVPAPPPAPPAAPAAPAPAPPGRTDIRVDRGTLADQLEEVRAALSDRQRAFMELVQTTEALRRRISQLEDELATRTQELKRLRIEAA